jgi:hypothetical protein
MLLMVLCLVSVGYGSAIAGLWLISLVRAPGRPKPFGWSFLVFGAPLCAALALATLSLDTAPPTTVALFGVRWQRTDAVVVRFVAHVVKAWVDGTGPAMTSPVTVLCLVTDQYQRPLSGATVSFTWREGKVAQRGAPMVTGSGGGAYSTLSVRRATFGKRLKIEVTATWRGQTSTALASFTP